MPKQHQLPTIEEYAELMEACETLLWNVDRREDIRDEEELGEARQVVSAAIAAFGPPFETRGVDDAR